MPQLKCFYLLVLTVFIAVGANASAPLDSVGVKIVNGKKFTLHKVDQKDYWYSVARRYKVNPIALQKANQNIQGDLKIGQTILIPITDKAFTLPPPSKVNETPAQENIALVKKPEAGKGKAVQNVVPSSEKPKDLNTAKNNVPLKADVANKGSVNETNSDKTTPLSPQTQKSEISGKGSETEVSKSEKNPNDNKFPLLHQVKKGETIFGISQEYNISLSDLIGWNNLVSDDLKIGKNLIVGFGNKQEREIIDNRKYENVASGKGKGTEEIKATSKETTKDAEKVDSKSLVGVTEINEVGIASWINDKEINPSKFYALHRTAPIGTIIKVINTLNNKEVFVKVVGALPNTGENNNVIIKMSKAAIEKIEALDQKFQVTLNYGNPN